MPTFGARIFFNLYPFFKEFIMSFVVRPIEFERGRLLQRAWGINAVNGSSERNLAIVSVEDHPHLTPSSQIVYVEGQVGSACRNSGFLVKAGDNVVDFIEYQPR
jgi:hypothetical protein